MTDKPRKMNRQAKRLASLEWTDYGNVTLIAAGRMHAEAIGFAHCVVLVRDEFDDSIPTATLEFSRQPTNYLCLNPRQGA